MIEPPELPDLPASQMDTDALSVLSYIFCDNIRFDRFVELWAYFMAGMPDSEQVKEFWEEVEGLGYYSIPNLLL
ncbi:hypothetical protein [Fibrisoma limi]|uniref:hypothetical protein n=1 Tax=Fibrisoma limi TaxID=663275 RepID=UPI0005871A82|nr:hypothetical protein [Fibrisoma limi]